MGATRRREAAWCGLCHFWRLRDGSQAVRGLQVEADPTGWTGAHRPQRTAGTWAGCQTVREVITKSLGGGLGLFPLGVAFGMMVIQAGMPWWMAPLLSIVVYAGSMEMLLVGLLAQATPVLTIAVTTLLVNSRHLFYAFTFPLQLVRHPLALAYSVYALTDETFAIVCGAPREWTQRSLVTLQVLLQGYWVVGGLLGTLCAMVLPPPVEGLEFALAALFIVLALDAARTREEIPSVVLAVASLGVGLIAVPRAALLTALGVFTIALLLRHVAGRRGADA